MTLPLLALCGPHPGPKEAAQLLAAYPAVQSVTLDLSGIGTYGRDFFAPICERWPDLRIVHADSQAGQLIRELLHPTPAGEWQPRTRDVKQRAARVVQSGRKSDDAAWLELYEKSLKR